VSRREIRSGDELTAKTDLRHISPEMRGRSPNDENAWAMTPPEGMPRRLLMAHERESSRKALRSLA